MKKSKISFDLEKYIETIGQASGELIGVEISTKSGTIFDDYFSATGIPADENIKILIDKIFEKNAKIVEFLDNCSKSQWKELSKISVLIGLFLARLTPGQILRLPEFKEVRRIRLSRKEEGD